MWHDLSLIVTAPYGWLIPFFGLVILAGLVALVLDATKVTVRLTPPRPESRETLQIVSAYYPSMRVVGGSDYRERKERAS